MPTIQQLVRKGTRSAGGENQSLQPWTLVLKDVAFA